MEVLEMISAQQEKVPGTDAWMVGEQLKDIIKREPHTAAILAEDLQNEAMDIVHAAGQIRAYANKQPKVKGCVVVPPQVAEGIIRTFYGLPEAGAEPEKEAPAQETATANGFLDLADFL